MGKAGSIYIPELPPMPAGAWRLRGLRFLHTHLEPEGISQEDLTDMLFLRLDAVLSLSVSEAGEPLSWQGATLAPARESAPPPGMRAGQTSAGMPYFITNMRAWHDAAFDFSAIIEELESGSGIRAPRDADKERAFLISVSTESQTAQNRHLDELEDLAATAGLAIGGRLIQRVCAPNPRLILGKGKLAELEVAAMNANAGILIFDGELSPAQLHNLADVTERKVLDRTQLILDIFARHAVTRAGKLQVELAQLAYAQPRLAGKNTALDRLMGGIGGRGPGESKLETDRRRSRERMAFLKKELETLRRQRSFTRARRARNGIPIASLVGYTNAGKSTLLNSLTASKTFTANQLFATLDPATRRLRFPKEREIVLSDTVGFIRNLPRELREAFRATLEELESSSLLLHVADASHPDVMDQISSVNSILEDMDLARIPSLLLLNKCDLLSPEDLADLRNACPAAIFLSGKTGDGFQELLIRVERELFMEKSSPLPRRAPEMLSFGEESYEK